MEIVALEEEPKRKRSGRKPTKPPVTRKKRVYPNKRSLSISGLVPEDAINARRAAEPRETFENREKHHSLQPFCTLSEFDVFPERIERNIEAADEEDIRECLRADAQALRIAAAYVDYFETQNRQIVKHKSSCNREEAKLHERSLVNRVLEEAHFDDVSSKEIKNILGGIEHSCMELSEWRRDAQAFKSKISGLGAKLEKTFVKMDGDRQKAFKKVMEEYELDTSGLHVLPATVQKYWTENEERRLRNALFIFGRDTDRVRDYVRIGRVPMTKQGTAKIKSKVQKILLLWRKHALPLPPAVAMLGKEYTQKGVQALNASSDFWRTFWPDINVMLPMDEVPFGRRKWVLPSEPIYENLVEDEVESESESE